MLAIQPISVSNSSTAKTVRPSFKGWDKESADAEKDFFEQQRQELDNLINDDNIPDKIKKPFKFFRVIANGAIEGLAVFGSVMMLAGLLKQTKSSKVAEGLADTIKPMGKKVAQGAKSITKVVSDLIQKAAKTKQGEQVINTYKKYAGTMKAKRKLVVLRKYYRSAKAVLNKILKPVKNITADKITKGTAAGLGIGSGLTGAYEASMKNQDLSILDEKPEVPVDEIEEYDEGVEE